MLAIVTKVSLFIAVIHLNDAALSGNSSQPSPVGQQKQKQQRQQQQQQQQQEAGQGAVLPTGPYFDQHNPTNVSAQLGSQVLLPCTVHQLINKSVLWVRLRDWHLLTVGRYTYSADKRFQSLRQGGPDTWALRIKNVQTSDEGRYQCQVNTQPSISHTIHLSVVVPVVEIADGVRNLYVEAGSMVTITCTISGSIYSPSYVFWYLNGELVRSGSERHEVSLERTSPDTTTSSLVIRTVAEADSGTYTCSPSNLPPASVVLQVLNVITKEAPQQLADNGLKVGLSQSCAVGYGYVRTVGTAKICRKLADSCTHGPGYIDQCNNDCICLENGGYGCTRLPCKEGERAEEPMSCTGDDDLPDRDGMRVFCEDGIVKLERNECAYGPAYIDDCGNDCDCISDSFYGCTRKACQPGQTAEVPLNCTDGRDLPTRSGRVTICHENIIKVMDEDDLDIYGSCSAEDEEGPCPEGCGEIERDDSCVTCGCAPGLRSGCVFGDTYIDECDNDCDCIDNRFYDCTRKACKPGETAEQPMKCDDDDGNLPLRPGRKVVCDDGIIKVLHQQSGQESEEACEHGAAFIDECGNDCECMGGVYACTLKGCQPDQTAQRPMACAEHDEDMPLPKRPGRRVYCEDGRVLLGEGPATCPLGQSHFQLDCNDCVCTDQNEPACTLKDCSQEEYSEFCGFDASAGLPPQCPADCGLVNNDNNCAYCKCGLGQPKEGEHIIPAGAPCPEGTVIGEQGGLIQKCVPEGSVCKEGEETQMYCNKCRCLNGRQYCTRRNCILPILQVMQAFEEKMTAMLAREKSLLRD